MSMLRYIIVLFDIQFNLQSSIISMFIIISVGIFNTINTYTYIYFKCSHYGLCSIHLYVFHYTLYIIFDKRITPIPTIYIGVY